MLGRAIVKIKTLILSGDGLNCERETARAFTIAGSQADIIHINDLLLNPHKIQAYEIFAIPGGFSFGDEISSGHILSLKMKHGLADSLDSFVSSGRLVIGICNGFQTLAKLGLLPMANNERSFSLTNNKNREFIDKWVNLKINSQKCIWTKGIESIELPIRHGEGRVVFKNSADYELLKNNEQIVFSYEEDVNGSYEKIAGVCDPSGRILGLMPHPEAAIHEFLLPSGKKKNKFTPALEIFKNAIDFAKENLR